MSQETGEGRGRIARFISKYSRPLTESAFSILIGVIIGSLLVMATGFSPLIFYRGLISGTFRSQRAFLDMLSYLTPLIMTGMSFAVAARANIFNIGAEGQMYLGALAANVVGYLTLPSVIHQVACLGAAFLAGAAWGFIAGVLKSKRGVNEVVSTIMLNWIAYYSVNYVATYKIYDPTSPWKTNSIQDTAILPFVAKGTSLSVSLLLAIAFAVVVFFVLWKTSLGYEIRAVGLASTAAEYGGIKPSRTIAKAMLIAGGCGGLAGGLEVLGRFWFLDNTLQVIRNRGFDGIAVSLVGRNHPIGIILSAVFFSMLDAGAGSVQIYTSGKGPGGLGVPLELGLAVTGIIIIAVAVPGLVHMIGDLIRKRRGS